MLSILVRVFFLQWCCDNDFRKTPGSSTRCIILMILTNQVAYPTIRNIFGALDLFLIVLSLIVLSLHGTSKLKEVVYIVQHYYTNSL